MRWMRWMRSITVGVVVVLLASLLAACSNGSDDAAPKRVRASGTTTTTSTTEPPPTTVVEEPPAPPAGATVLADGEAEDPLVSGGPRPPRPPGPARAPAGKVRPTGHIEIPAIGLSHQTYEGIELRVINFGPSHWPGTAMPGHRGNTVFPGHRTTYSRPFWDIDKLRPGNEVIFTTPEGRFTYQVTETFIVGEKETRIVNPTDDATFTIFACHPKGSARQRYVAKGKLVSPPAQPQGQSPPPPPPTTSTTAAPTTTTTAPPPEEPPPSDQPGDVVPDLPG